MSRAFLRSANPLWPQERPERHAQGPSRRAHGNPPSQHAIGRQGTFQAAESAPGRRLRLRADGLRLDAHRQCAAGGRLRRVGAAASDRVSKRQVRAQHHRRGRQDQRRRPAFRPPHRRAGRCLRHGIPARHQGPRRGRAGRRTPRHRTHRRDHPHDRGAHGKRPRLRGGRRRQPGGGRRTRHPCAVPRAFRSSLRFARQTQPRRDARRGASGSRPLQEGSQGFRIVEAVERRAPRLGQPLGTRASRLAHRMLGDDPQASGRGDRHPRRRQRSGLSASRERVRAEPLRQRRQGERALLDAQRHAHVRRDEDVQEPRQRRHHPRTARRPRRRNAPLRPPLRPLPAKPGVERRAARAGEGQPRRAVPRTARRQRQRHVGRLRQRRSKRLSRGRCRCARRRSQHAQGAGGPARAGAQHPSG